MAPPKRTKAQIAKDEAEDKGYHDGRFGGYLPLETYTHEEFKAYNRGHASGSKIPCRF